MEKVHVFVAGSITLKKERDAIRALFMSINNAVQERMSYYVMSFDDFGTYGQQKDYDEFIEKADYVIFIIDQEMGTGKHTVAEYDCARNAQKMYTVASKNKKREDKPKILVYYRQIHEMIRRPDFILRCIKDGQYYSIYTDVADLRSQLLYTMFIDIVNKQNKELTEQDDKIKNLQLAMVNMMKDSELITDDNKVVSLSVKSTAQSQSDAGVDADLNIEEYLNQSAVDENVPDCSDIPRNVVIDVVTKLHTSLINATKSILTMVQDLADTGDLSFPRQVAAVTELKDCLQTSVNVLPDYIYAEIESFAINYPQKGYNTILNVLRGIINAGVTSLDVGSLEALHSELLKAMPVDETQDQLNALIHTLQDYCNSL